MQVSSEALRLFRSAGRALRATYAAQFVRSVPRKAMCLEPPDCRALWAMAKLAGDDMEIHGGPLLTG